MNRVCILSRFIRGSVLLGILGIIPGCGDDDLVSPGSGNEATWEDSEVRNLDLAGVHLIVADTVNGTITLRGQASTSARLEVHETVRASTLQEAQEVGALVDVDVQIVGEELVVHSVVPDSLTGVEVRVHYDLTCPAGVDVVIEVVNGEISVDQTSGAITAEVVNGRVDIAPAADADGAVVVRVINGVVAAVLLDGVAYHLAASTVTGCIRAELDGSAVDRCRAVPQVVELGASGGVPCGLSVVNGTIEVTGG